MSVEFFNAPILNSPYVAPGRHWELDEFGQPTQRIAEGRRPAAFVTPIPKAKKQTRAQTALVLDEGKGLSTEDQAYDIRSLINELRLQVDRWRSIKNAEQWRVTPETRRLLQHWRSHNFSSIRPFFCQIEAVETVTTVMAMIIAWQTINAARHPSSNRLTRGFLVVTPGITIRDSRRALAL